MVNPSNSSSQGRKQRKYRYTAPNHIRRKMVFIHLSKELKAKLKTKRRSIQAKKLDKVKVMRGDYKGKEGKIAKIDLSRMKVYVEGIVAKTAKGVEKLVALEPSKLMLISGEFVKDRLEALNRASKTEGSQQQPSQKK